MASPLVYLYDKYQEGFSVRVALTIYSAQLDKYFQSMPVNILIPYNILIPGFKCESVIMNYCKLCAYMVVRVHRFSLSSQAKTPVLKTCALYILEDTQHSSLGH